jgi:uncharacterized protein (DUF1800 family)
VCSLTLHAQLTVYDDFVGGGHSEDILISSSSNFTDPEWDDNSSPKHSIDGEGLNGPEAEAARFLYQAALGGRRVDIDNLSKTLDFEGWMDEQIAFPKTNMLALSRASYEAERQMFIDLFGNDSDLEYYDAHFQYAWWQAAMKRPDIFRQRIAFALSEIFVISKDSDIRNHGDGLASYYDVLLTHAFGNYRDLIEEIALHPSMGIYLSHFRNQKTDLEENIYPDENFARELMQLFSIGLFQLKLNGDLKLDSNGNPIPAYDAEDVRNLAKVFTGLGAGDITQQGVDEGHTMSFYTSARLLNYTSPMIMYEDFHEEGEKVILGNKVIPEGQTGMEDIQLALDYIFNHPNVGPFISRRLIQQLVKSNPSPAYIADVASVFNNNGEGERGDLEAVIKEILLHEEARNCLWQEEPSNGKLKAPVGRHLQFARYYAEREDIPYFWMQGFPFEEQTYQLPLSSPTVFNFYLPDYQPQGEISEQGLYAPEFEIYNSVTSLGFANIADTWIRQDRVFSLLNLNYTVPVHRERLLAAAQNPEVLVNMLDVALCQGQMTSTTREIIIQGLEDLNFGTEYLQNRVEMALYLTLISPDFAIQK